MGSCNPLKKKWGYAIIEVYDYWEAASGFNEK
jgi:hypothetical protein